MIRGVDAYPERTLAELLGIEATRLLQEGRERGSLWDAEVFAAAPRLLNTPARVRIEGAFSLLGIEILGSCVWISEVEKRTLLDNRRNSLQELLNRPPSISDPSSQPRQRERLERELSDVQVAIHRLEDGEYGECSFCGQLIEWAVLKVIPGKLYCKAECQTAAREESWKLDHSAAKLLSVARPSIRQMDELRTMAGDRDGVGSIWFSCNLSRQVWPSPNRRFTLPGDRNYLQGKSDYLDGVVRLVLSHRWIGGRFCIDRDRIAISSSGIAILTFSS